NLCVCFNIREDSLSDLRMALHLATFLEAQSSRLLKKSRGKANLPNVMNESADLGEVLFLGSEAHPDCDVVGIDRDRARVSCGIPISSVKRRHKSRGERQVGSFQSYVGVNKVGSKFALILIENEKALRSECRDHKKGKRDRRYAIVRERKEGDDRRV